MNIPTVGQSIVLVESFETDFGNVPIGATGVIVEVTDEHIWVRLPQQFDCLVDDKTIMPFYDVNGKSLTNGDAGVNYNGKQLTPLEYFHYCCIVS